MALTHLNWECFTTVVSLLSMGFGIRRKVLTWPISLAITLVNLEITYHKGLYHACFSNGLGLLFLCYGWIQWHRPRDPAVAEIRRTSMKEWTGLGVCGLGMGCLLFGILTHFGAFTVRLGTVSTLLTFCGLWLTANKKLESYWIWMGKNVIELYTSYQAGLYWFAFKYGVYTLASLYGSFAWYRAHRVQAIPNKDRLMT